jgi:uncharacterized RDD family membrane protein YckC
MEPVGVGRRAVAVLIDSILLFIVGYLIAALTGQTTATGFNMTGAPFFLWLAISLAYFIVMEATSGATLGKRVMHLKVVKQDGTPMDWQASIARNVLRLIDGFLFYLVGAIVIWVSKTKQRLGDMAAHTIVVSARAWIPALLVLAFACGHAPETLAGSPRYTDLVLSDAKNGAPKKAFKPGTAKIFLYAKLVDVPSGSVVKGAWIAEKTRVAPANYKIDEKELHIGPMMSEVTYSLSKPNAGWPVGDYRVDLFIDNKPAGNVKFKVAK